MLDDDPECWGEVARWVDAARVANTMAHNRIGLMGHYYGGMLDIYTDVTRQCAYFGGHVEMLEVEELAALREGVSEADVQADVERALRAAGHQGQLRFRGFNQEMHYGQVLAGPSGAVPGYSDSPLCGPGPNVVLGKGPDGHILRAGDPVIADLVGGHEGYLADQTRTFSVGEPPADLAEAHAAALAILRLVEAELRPGVAPSRLYALAEEAARDAGLADAFMGAGPERVRFLGHGVGLEIDELPVLAPGFDEPIAAGTTVAVEPKFVFPGRGAVGVENTYAVGEDGPERLTTAPEELIAV
jgi:Xaa-Pro aminopeptidase